MEEEALVHGSTMVKGGEQVNHHIRFLSEESEISDYSDSIDDFEGNEQNILKLRQKNRQKKKASSLSKKHRGQVLMNWWRIVQSLGRVTKEGIKFVLLIEERRLSR
jgi:hypothetical protein